MTDTVLLAGGTGDLGLRIARALRARAVAVRALVRPGTADERIAPLREAGCGVVIASIDDAAAMRAACTGAVCVVSALSGLEDTIIGAQGKLLDAAVAAGVPRFIPSDFAMDYRSIPAAENRNFALRTGFRERIDAAPIRATSIFNGAFMDMVVGQMPLIAKPIRRVVWIGNRDQKLQMTTKDDVAAVTAAAALDAEAPRNLHITGSEVTVGDLAAIMTGLTGDRYRRLHVASLGGLVRVIKVIRRVWPQEGAVFPVWQGMQYLHNMFAGYAPTDGTDNDRYPGIVFTPVREVLADSLADAPGLAAG